MTSILLSFINLCRLRAAPQDLPYSILLMGATLVCYFLAGLGIASSEQAFGPALLTSVVDVVLLVGLARLALWITNHGARAMQTVTALAGTGTLFELLAWPLIATMQGVTAGAPSTTLSFLLLALIVWNIVVIGHILRHALDMTMWIACGIALLYVYTSMRVMSALYIAGT